MSNIKAFRYRLGALVACDFAGQTMTAIECADVLCAHPIQILNVDIVVIYLPRGEVYNDLVHRADVLAALGRCNACALLHEQHNEGDRDDCAYILREIEEDMKAAQVST